LALQRIANILPSESLHLIANILPEAVLGTKETNEKAREAAYDLVVGMGQKMKQGGAVRNEMIDRDAEASIGEYFVMVYAGLAGSSQHMISGTITALSRLLYEFKGLFRVIDCPNRQMICLRRCLTTF
jgi:ribosomal RNA-processing protein 12